MSDRIKTVAVAALASLVFASPAARAQDARQIVEETQRRSEAASQRYEGTLRVVDGKRKISEKRWRFERIGSHGMSRSALRFIAPPEVDGVALLVVNHPERSSDQWMWTPAIQRDRRIALQDRSTRFFGTDFSFEDLEERDVDQYDYRLLAEETVEGVRCWVIESVPKRTKRSQYSKSHVWIRQDRHAYVRVDAYRGDEVLRRIVYRMLEPVQGIWTARELEVTDLGRDSRTILTLDRLEYNVPMREDDFTVQALRRR